MPESPLPLVMAFPMPTTDELSKAYLELHQAAHGEAESKRRLGNPANLPRPWDPPTCTTRRLRAELWSWLDNVVTWLNHEYVWDPAAGLIPACWPLHPHLVHEIAVLADQRRRAGLDLTSGSIEEWHRYCLPAFYERFKARLHNGCDERHSPWPAQPRHDRHQRHATLRTDAFNSDLDSLNDTPPQQTPADEPPPPTQDQEPPDDLDIVKPPVLRLAADNGETINPVTGEVS